jgi:nucleotide-binding universal stress UspA family protein
MEIEMYDRILVPLDGSRLSELVLPHVEALAEKFGSSIVLIRVNAPLSASSAAASPPQDPTLVHRLEQQAAEGQLKGVADGLQAKGYTVHLEMPTGSAAHEILETARASEVRLIAMTTHGFGGLGRLLFGSVADEVLRHAPCPILLVRVDEGMARRAKLENVVF